MLDRDENVVYDFKLQDIDIDMYIGYKTFIDREFKILSKYLIDRMIQPTDIKQNELMFYFKEYLKFKGNNYSIWHL